MSEEVYHIFIWNEKAIEQNLVSLQKFSDKEAALEAANKLETKGAMYKVVHGKELSIIKSFDFQC